MNDGSKMSFMEHLEELRIRLIRSIIAIFVGIIICWFFREELLALLLSPLYSAWSQVDGLPEPRPLNFSNMLEPFIAYMKLSAVGGFFLASPVVLYQTWKFISPGLYRRERRLAVPFVLCSTLLFVGGSLFAYLVMFPVGFRFFLDFAAGREMSVLEAKATATRVEIRDGKMEDAAAGPREPGRAKPQDRPARAQDNASKQASEQSWYAWLAGRILKTACGRFSASAEPGSSGILLAFDWNAARCGDLPSLKSLKRDGDGLIVRWADSRSAETGYEAVTAFDRTGEPGPHVYTLSVPASPGIGQLAPMLMVKDYLSFALQLIFAFGVVFELPILITFLAFAGIVNYKQLLAFSRYFIVIATIVGAILTPPDVLSQIMLTVPLVLLYFISILIVYFVGPKVSD